jgi:hypothetical protein
MPGNGTRSLSGRRHREPHTLRDDDSHTPGSDSQEGKSSARADKEHMHAAVELNGLLYAEVVTTGELVTALRA